MQRKIIFFNEATGKNDEKWVDEGHSRAVCRIAESEALYRSNRTMEYLRPTQVSTLSARGSGISIQNKRLS